MTLILIILLSLIYLLIPKIQIELNGDKVSNLNIGEEYIELGATAYLKKVFSTQEIEVKIIGDVPQKIGEYIVTYEANYKKYTQKKKRLVKVIDNQKPLITLNKEVVGCKKNKLIDIDANVFDNYDGDLKNELQYKINDNRIELYVKDSSGNASTYETKIKYIDSEKPKITLNGSSEIYLTLNSEYIEYGARAFDSCDGDITNQIKINGEVNTATEGAYVITYSVTDSDNKTTEITRKIIVTSQNVPDKIHNGTIYLTFDDGPGKYTESFLDVLDKYNVKATFFVTSQFPKYQSLIKEEHKRGHAVGIHTYSHKWSIYSSESTYLDDFNKMSNIVYEETGIYPKIFRFPGGSSNTVSKKYHKEIMTNLAKLMEQKGYIYFDWTFDSGDTSKNKNSKEDIIRTVKSYLKGDGQYIILMHDIKKNTLEALPEIIEYAQKKGYQFATITETTPVAHFKIAN